MPSPGRIGLAALGFAALIAATYLGFRSGKEAKPILSPHRSTSPETPVESTSGKSADALTREAKRARQIQTTGDGAVIPTDSVPHPLQTPSAAANRAASVLSGSARATDAHTASEPNGASDRPRGWWLVGKDATNCTLETDHRYAQSGTASGLLRSTNSTPAQWCAILQSSASGRFRGMRLEFSAYLSTQNATGGGSLWFRAENAQGLMVAFENQDRHPLGGNTPWTFEVIVIDVPETAQAIFYGAAFRNGGLLWMDSANFSVVDKSVPLTGSPLTGRAVFNPHLDLATLHAEPENLDFEQTVPVGSEPR